MDHQIIRFKRDVEDAEQARLLLEAAGVDYFTGLAEIQAKSEEQRLYAANARIRVLANLWRNIEPDYKNPEFALVIVNAANRHHDARFWIDNDPVFNINITSCLDDDIEAELEQ